MTFNDALINLFAAEYAETNKVSYDECMKQIKTNRALTEPIKDTIDTYHSINFENARGVFNMAVGEILNDHFFVRIN